MAAENPASSQRRIVAVLAIDVVGWSRLMGRDEVGTLDRLKACRRELVAPTVARRGGRIVKLTGDGVLALFPSVVEAAQAAIEIQRAMAERNRDLPADRRLDLRIGLNLGDVIADDGDIYGDGVNIAARLEAQAEPGGIALSGTAFDQLRHKLDVPLDVLGEQQLKNIAEPTRVYRVRLDGAAPARPHAGPSRRRLALVVGGLGALAAIAIAVLVGVGPFTPAWRGGTQGAPAIAVLPFASPGASDDQSYLADGMTEDLVTRLAKLSGLLVIASSSTRDYRDPSPDIRAIARALGVRYVLTGSVRRARDRLRINVQLVDSQSGAHLWAESYDRRAGEVFGVEDEVVAAVVGALRVAMTPAEQSRLARLPTSNLEAYDLYLRAEHAARSGDLARLAEALPLYERAARLDPRFAAAHAGAGRLAAAIWREDMGFVLPPPLARALAYEHAGRALELGPSDPSPYSILALLRVQDRQYEDALDAARRAVALGPGDAAAQAALVEVLSFTGRHREAAEAAGRTLRLNPKLTVRERTQVGLAFLLNGDLPEAVAALRQASDEAPELDLPHRLLAAALERSGRRAEARAEADAARRALPHASLEAIRAAYGSFQRPEDLDAILASLHRAGVTLWPFGFEPDPEAALDGAAINALALGHTGRGTLGTGAPALMQIRQDGTMAWRTPNTILTGTVRIEHDQLCEISGSSLAGRPLCGPVQTTTPSSAAPSTHIYVNPVKLFRFSVD